MSFILLPFLVNVFVSAVHPPGDGVAGEQEAGAIDLSVNCPGKLPSGFAAGF